MVASAAYRHQPCCQLEKGDLLDDLKHTNQQVYSGRRIMIVNIADDAYLALYVET